MFIGLGMGEKNFCSHCGLCMSFVRFFGCSLWFYDPSPQTWLQQGRITHVFIDGIPIRRYHKGVVFLSRSLW